MRLYTLLSALPHDRHVSVAELASIQFASSAAHNVLPAPAGEVLRTVQLNRRHGYSVGALVGVQLVEKVVEALGMGLAALAVSALSGGLPRSLSASLYAFAALGAGGAALVLLVGWRFGDRVRHAERRERPGAWQRARDAVAGFLGRLGASMHALRSPSLWLRALAGSVLSDLANALTVGLCLHAVGISLPLSGWFLVMLATRAAGLLPSTPGQFGVQEAGAVVALGLLGVDHSRALAVALLHHIAHFVPVTLAGLVQMRHYFVARAPA